MKISAIALGLTLVAGTALAQKPESPASQSGKTTAQSSQPATQASTSDLKTQTFKGTLVDAACAKGASRASTSGQSSADRENSSGQPAGATGKSEATKKEANAGANAGSSCSISSSSGEFALQTKDGRTLAFDAVGNERVKQGLLNRKSWANAGIAGKPIEATVNGTQTGDSLMVLSIH